ncbi:mechanosensitive ion channel protein MscS [Xenophilus sp. AP218F]|nr:mechanosensitive ion channel domain-containing protein [Chromobacterium sp. ASV5]OWY40846.1 mechanosensitive ion channel protein MscS [Xenophilus sp. AP218F]
MKTLLARLSLLLACCLAGAAFAAEPHPTPDLGDNARTLTLDNRPIFLFLSRQGTLTPEQRASRALERIAALEDADLDHPVQTLSYLSGGQRNVQLSLNKKPLFTLTEADLDPADALTLDQAAQKVVDRLNEVRLGALEQRSPQQMAKAAALALLASALFAVALGLILRGRRLSRRRLAQRPVAPLNWLHSRYDLRGVLRGLECRLVDLTALLCALFAGYLWLSYVLGRFPYTRPLGKRLGESLLGLVGELAQDMLAALPGLVTVALIFLLTRLISRGLGLLFDAVERGQLELPGLHAETVGATRRLTSVALWLFALIVAYPYFPGAGSDAFKGVSVFFGLMVTLGSAGIMNHAMSGLVLIYSRALRPGDFVQIGDVEGFVSELSTLSTKIVTRQDYEITVPNAVAVGGKVINCSRRAPGLGPIACTSVTIGYDTPWRQVHAMLELAARRTAGLDASHPPKVRQTGLQDYYVAYELQVWLAAGQKPPAVKNELHGHIQDVFNEFGVQIMSPHFRAQPEQDVVVPKARWFAAPATPPEPD